MLKQDGTGCVHGRKKMWELELPTRTSAPLLRANLQSLSLTLHHRHILPIQHVQKRGVSRLLLEVIRPQ
jgi:hypothetical protein